MYDELGFPSPPGQGGTPADMFTLAANYYAESGSLKEEVRCTTVHDCLTEIDRERSRAFKEDLMAGDPTRACGGQYVIPSSPGYNNLVLAHP